MTDITLEDMIKKINFEGKCLEEDGKKFVVYEISPDKIKLYVHKVSIHSGNNLITRARLLTILEEEIPDNTIVQGFNYSVSERGLDTGKSYHVLDFEPEQKNEVIEFLNTYLASRPTKT